MPVAAQTTQAVVSEDSFLGFEHVTANFIYCPNQFFDVCLPNCSRTVIRIVAYMLLRTLGWLDSNGDPIEQNVRFAGDRTEADPKAASLLALVL